MEQVLPLTKVDKMRYLILLLLATPVYAQNSVYIDQIGNNNTIYVDQNGSTNKSITILNGGDNNTISVFQQDSGTQQAFIGTVPNQPPGSTNNNQFVYPNTNNNNNTLSIVQTGSGNHTAAINLDPTTSNNNNTASIMQGGAASKSFNLNLSGSGIGATVIQNNPTVPDAASMSIQCLSPPCNGYSYTKH